MDHMKIKREVSRPSILEPFREDLFDNQALSERNYYLDSGRSKSNAAIEKLLSQAPEGLDSPILDPESDVAYFKLFFYLQDAQHYLGEAEVNNKKQHCVISLEAERSAINRNANKQLPEFQRSENLTDRMCLVRTIYNTKKVFVPAERCKSGHKLLHFLKVKCPELDPFKDLREADPAIENQLLKYEKDQMVLTYKFGILYCQNPNQTEDEMYSNNNPSEDFQFFLKTIAEKITLKGHTDFRGGLDVKSNTTGTESYFTKWRDYQIMFHVSTCLPYSNFDKQQIERKRHLGNDIILVLFTDKSGKFNPVPIKSNFNHVFAAVAREKDFGCFRINVATKPGVPAFGPDIPHNSLVEEEKFKDWFLTKLINGQRAAMYAPNFKKKLQGTRVELLASYFETFKKRKKSFFPESTKSQPVVVNPEIGTVRKQVGGSQGPLPQNATSTSIDTTYTNGDKYVGEVNAKGEKHGKGKYRFANGDEYQGEFQNDFYHGKGVLTKVNGDRYEGDFSHDLYHGYGVSKYASGDCYQGSYVNGKKHGYGCYKHADGSGYEGNFVDGQVSGFGKYKYVNGDVFRGNFQQGVYQGAGRFDYSNGDTFEGTFQSGVRQGFGLYTYQGGNSYYEGNYAKGFRQGIGTLKEENGDLYQGEFELGLPGGFGRYEFSNGDCYEGEFSDNLFNGTGKYTSASGFYHGEFKAGKRHGKGKMAKKSGDLYIGQFKDDLIHGHGLYIWSAGTRYLGEFENGSPNGKGTLINDGKIFQGVFENGMLVN